MVETTRQFPAQALVEKSQASAPLFVRYRKISTLKPNPHNSRKHPPEQLAQLAASIKKYNYTRPVGIAADGTIVTGHGIVEASKLLGREYVPTISLDALTPEQQRAYVIADNKLAENSSWDLPTLAIELEHFLLPNSEVDISFTGFKMAEIDLIIEEAKTKPDPDDDFSSEEAGKAVSQTGDLWCLGKHRVFCGNALDVSTYQQLLGERRADVVFIDPPYNVRIPGHASGHGAIKHRDFAMASGEMDETEFVAFLVNALNLVAQHSSAGSVHFVCMDWRHASNLMLAGSQAYDTLLNICVWVKDNGGMGSFYRSQHEFVFVYRNGKAPHRNNIQLGKYGRNRTNVWNYPGINTLSRRGEEGNLLALHPTVKPVALVADALLDVSARGDLVVDTFLGSGTSLLAAERVGRTCYGMELDPLYVDVIIRRWQRYTGDSAIHAVTGETFAAREVTMGEVVLG